MFSFFNTLRRKKTPQKLKEALVYNGHEVIVFREAYRRTLKVSISVDGQIKMRASMGLSNDEILRFLEKNKKWLETQQSKFQQIRLKNPRKSFNFGEKIPLLGKNLTLNLQQTAAGKISLSIQGEELICHYNPKKVANDDVEKAVEKEIRKYFAHFAKSYISHRIENLAQKMNLFPSALCFRSQKTRWGSCSSQGKISINWRLVVAPIEVIDYVLIHELAHLKHLDHSKNFWSLVEQFSPNFKQCRKWLRDHRFASDFLSEESELHRD